MPSGYKPFGNEGPSVRASSLVGIETVEHFYNRAKELIQGKKLSVADAHKLVTDHQDHPMIHEAGLFLSAVHNSADEMDIVFDLNLNMPLSHMGYKLDGNKRFVNYCESKEWLCNRASGPVINYGNTTGDMGYCASDLVVNFGKTDACIGRGAQGPVMDFGGGSYWVKPILGLTIALKDPKSLFGIDRFFGRPVLKEEECKELPELTDYLENIRKKLELGKDNPSAAFATLDELGSEPGKKVQSDIYQILKDTGSRVGLRFRE